MEYNSNKRTKLNQFNAKLNFYYFKSTKLFANFFDQYDN